MTRGPVYDEALDGARLATQMHRVRDYMLRHDFVTLAKIRHDLEYLYQRNFPEASVSAQLRHLRKKAFGSYILERRRAGKEKKGLFEYRLIRPTGELLQQPMLDFLTTPTA